MIQKSTNNNNYLVAIAIKLFFYTKYLNNINWRRCHVLPLTSTTPQSCILQQSISKFFLASISLIILCLVLVIEMIEMRRK